MLGSDDHNERLSHLCDALVPVSGLHLPSIFITKNFKSKLKIFKKNFVLKLYN